MIDIEQLAQRIPAWTKRPIHVEAMSGGITNHNLRVTIGEKGTQEDTYMVRLCAPGVAIHGIDRQAEQRCVQASANAGIAPGFVAFVDDLPTGNAVLVTRYVASQTLNASEVSHPSILPRIVDLLRRTHMLNNFGGRFDVFRIFERCLAFARTQQAPLPSFVAEVETQMQRIEHVTQCSPMPLVPCHNDLLPANFLLDQSDRLWLIDWEYAGWGDRFFDLGNLSVNNEFSDAQDWQLINEYFGSTDSAAYARLKLMKIVSDAREGIWGMVQWSISSLDFDYAEYGTRHLERFVSNCASTTFDEWMKEIKLRSKW